MFRTVIYVFVAALAMALAAPAGAHPFGREYYAYRTVVDLKGADLRIAVTVEAPVMAVLAMYDKEYGHLAEIGEEEDKAFFQAMLDQISGALTLTIDGKPVAASWTATDNPINGRAGEKSFYYMLSTKVSGALADAPCALQLTNGAFAGQQAYFSAWVRPGEGWAVEQNSYDALGAASQAEDVSEVEAAWSKDEQYRVLTARVVRQEAGG